MKGQLQRICIHTIESSKIPTLERKIKCWDVHPGSIAIFLSGWDNQFLCTEIKSIDVISLERCITWSLCTFAYVSSRKLRYYKPHYKSIFKSLRKAATYTYQECWRQLCRTVWSKVNTVTMKSFLLWTLGSSCQQRFWKSLFSWAKVLSWEG